MSTDEHNTQDDTIELLRFLGSREGGRARTPERYTWGVAYEDGTECREYDDVRPDGRGFAEREAKTVCFVTLFEPERGKAAHSVFVPRGAEPVFFRRRFIAIDAGANEQGRATVHCIGWKQGEQAMYLFVFEDGSKLYTDDLQAV